MSRGLGLTMLLASLAIVGVLMAMNMRTNGPASPAVSRATIQAVQVASTADFLQAAQQLELLKAQAGTYAGATLQSLSAVRLVSANELTYCLQTASGTAAQHFTGPGGTVTAGPC